MSSHPELGPLADHPDAAVYEDCGLNEFHEEPLYQRLCRLVARRPTLLALHELAPPSQRRALLLFAALHERVLALGRPQGLGAWYASVGGTRSPDDPGMGSALDALVERDHAALARSMRERATQTNEIGRCTVLWPALQAVAARTGRQQLALFDLGCSAGLNLGVDAYRLRYEHAAGAQVLGPEGDERPTLTARVHGPLPPLSGPIELVQRLGVDPQPVPLHDANALRWLRACLWPSDRGRDLRLRQAAALAQQQRWPVERQADGLARLTQWLDSLPPQLQPVLFHSWVLAYFDADALADFRARAEALVHGRGLAWLSAEDDARTAALGGVTLPTKHLPAELRASPVAQTFWRLQTPGCTELLARSHPHGAWLEWLTD